jgi:hypothetical protein
MMVGSQNVVPLSLASHTHAQKRQRQNVLVGVPPPRRSLQDMGLLPLTAKNQASLPYWFAPAFRAPEASLTNYGGSSLIATPEVRLFDQQQSYPVCMVCGDVIQGGGFSCAVEGCGMSVDSECSIRRGYFIDEFWFCPYHSQSSVQSALPGDKNDFDDQDGSDEKHDHDQYSLPGPQAPLGGPSEATGTGSVSV